MMYIDAKIVVQFLIRKSWLLLAIWITSFCLSFISLSLKSSTYRVEVPIVEYIGNYKNLVDYNNLLASEDITNEYIHSLVLEVLLDEDLQNQLFADLSPLNNGQLGSIKEETFAKTTSGNEFRILKRPSLNSKRSHVIEFFVESPKDGLEMSKQIIDRANALVVTRLAALVSTVENDWIDEIQTEIENLKKQQNSQIKILNDKVNRHLSFLKNQRELAKKAGINQFSIDEGMYLSLWQKHTITPEEEIIFSPIFTIGTELLDVLIDQSKADANLQKTKIKVDNQNRIRKLNQEMQTLLRQRRNSQFRLSVMNNNFRAIKSNVDKTRFYNLKPNKWLFSALISTLIASIFIIILISKNTLSGANGQ